MEDDSDELSHVSRLTKVLTSDNNMEQEFQHSSNFCDFEEMYTKVYFPKIKQSVFQYLRCDIKCQSPLSMQDTNMCLENCIQHKYVENFYSNLIDIVSHHLAELSQMLTEMSIESLSDTCCYILKFHTTLKVFGNFLNLFCPFFKSLNAVYIRPQLRTTLEEVILNLFKALVVGSHACRLIESMRKVREVPFTVQPSVMHDVANALYYMKPDCRQNNSDLFACYIPNAITPLKSSDLDKEKESVKLMQMSIRQEFNNNLRSSIRKRSSDDLQKEDSECSQSSLLASLLMGLGT